MSAAYSQRLIDLLSDRSLSLTEAINGSGVLRVVEGDDVAPLVHAAAVLRDADHKILEDIRNSLDNI